MGESRTPGPRRARPRRRGPVCWPRSTSWPRRSRFSSRSRRS